jgi:hypothetical protein
MGSNKKQNTVNTFTGMNINFHAENVYTKHRVHLSYVSEGDNSYKTYKKNS